MSSSCSHWWHAPIYITISVVLAIVAISAPFQDSNSKTPIPLSSLKPDSPIQHELSSNASLALRKSGFNFMATLLQISPELFLSSSQSTIFAIQDHTISNISLPPWVLKDLLKYHTSPSRITMDDLLNQTQNSCIPTLLHGKNLTVTNVNRTENSVEINGVLISHPDIFTQGPYSIHGVLKPFSLLNRHEFHPGFDLLGTTNICDSNSTMISNFTSPRKMVPWTRIIRLLSSSGFVSFAIGLNSVLNNIFMDPMIMDSVTIFAPLDFAYVASTSPLLLEKIVRVHILPERFTYRELESLSTNASIRTLVPDVNLGITVGSKVKENMIAINGVEITQPDFYSSSEFVVHGISQPFEMSEVS